MLLRLWILFYRIRDMFRPDPPDDLDEIIAGMNWLNLPANLLDSAAWDQYWIGHIEHGFGPQIIDMFLDDSMLVKVMKDEGMKRVLCAGNGISQEPKILAAAGMDVVALDISPQAADIAKNFQIPIGAISQYYGPGFERPGGKLEFVTGNILDPTICPGPFDVIIERSTVQNYCSNDIGSVMNSLAQRLSKNGLFLSHCHNGAWRPPAKRVHLFESWFQNAGWTIWNGAGPKPPGRVAWLSLSTG
jgi:Methyltransferase domain